MKAHAQELVAAAAQALAGRPHTEAELHEALQTRDRHLIPRTASFTARDAAQAARGRGVASAAARHVGACEDRVRRGSGVTPK